MKRLENLKYLVDSIRIVWHSSKKDATYSVVILLFLSVLPLASVYLMKLIVDSVTAGITAADKAAAFQEIMLYIGLIGITAAGIHFLTSINSFLSERLSLKVLDHLSDILHKKSIEVDLEYYENPDYYDTLHRAQRGAIHKPTSAFNNSILLLQNLLSMIGMMAILISFHWIVIFIVFVAVIPGLVFRLFFSHRLFSWDRSTTAAQRHAYYYNYLLTGDVNAKEIRLFQLGPLFIKRFHDVRLDLRTEKLTISRKRSFAEILSQFVTVFTIYGSFGFMAWRAIYGYITLGDLIMYYQAFQRGLNYFANLLKSAAAVYEDTLYLSNLFEFLNLQPRIIGPEKPVPMFKKLESGITLANVSFVYPSTHRRVLNDISVNIKPGEHVALVGRNGAGKSTLIKLICRLYDPAIGTIQMDGIDIQQFDVDKLRQQISVVFQDFVRYHLRVKDNVWFGNIQLDEQSDLIQQSAMSAGIDSVIQNLPHQYDSILGKMFEHGSELSVGEWQKIALARAFLRDAQIIILDEPTSAMDARAEFEIFEKFKALAHGKTAFLISHRLSTAKLADRILVLEQGRIVEDGSHDTLMKRDGVYSKMFALQSQYYK
jgi:ATP-binding cassette subfamily B protein